MYVDVILKPKNQISVQLQLIDGNVEQGTIYVEGNERVLDLLNNGVSFLPFETEDKELIIINKVTIAQIKPFDRKRMKERYRQPYQMPAV